MGLKDSKRALADGDKHVHGDFPGDNESMALLSLETPLKCYECMAAGERTAGHRQINFYGSHANRISDAISLKRGELLRILRLLKSRIPSASRDTRSHYEDLVMRINTSLGLISSSTDRPSVYGYSPQASRLLRLAFAQIIYMYKLLSVSLKFGFLDRTGLRRLSYYETHIIIPVQ